MSYRRMILFNSRRERQVRFQIFKNVFSGAGGGESPPEPETLQERYRDNFSEDTVGTGALPAGFTSVDDADAAYEIVTDAGSEGGKAFTITKSGLSRTRIFKTLPEEVDDVDILVVFEVSTTGLAPGIIINSTGEAGAATEYLLEAFEDSVNIWEGTAGTYNIRESGSLAVSPDLTSGTVYAMRFRRNGTSLKGRLWEYENAIEPPFWNAEWTDASPLTGGQIGINFPSASGTITIHFISIGTEGVAATSLAESALPFHGLITTSSEDGSVRVADFEDETNQSIIIIAGSATDANLRGVGINRLTGRIYVPYRAVDEVYSYDSYGKNKTLVTDAITDPYGVVFDELTNKLFISSFLTGNVYSCDPDGSNLVLLLSGTANGGYLSLDKKNRKLFNIRGGTVYANDLDGSNEISFGTLTSLLHAFSDGTTVAFADFDASGVPDGIFTKPYASPGASFTNVNSLGVYQAIAASDDFSKSWAVRPTTQLLNWNQFPPTGVAGTAGQSFLNIRFVEYYYDYGRWSESYCITLNSAARSEDMTDYLGTIYLDDMPASFWTVVKSDGGDIRLAKADGTRIPHHVVDIDTVAETGIVRFKYPGVMPAASDVDIRLFAGNVNANMEAADSIYGQHNTYKSTFAAVYDFIEDPGSVSTLSDATTNGRDGTIGTNNAAWASGDQVDSPFGKAYSFDAADQRFVNLPASVWPGTSTNFTIRIKTRIDASGVGTFRDFFSVVPTAGIMGVVFMGVWDADTLNSGMSDTSDNLYQATDDAEVVPDTWYSLTTRFNAADTANEFKAFSAGLEIADADFVNTRKSADAEGAYVGSGWFNGNQVTYFQGDIAEIMILHEAISDAEIAAMDTNVQNPASFYSIVDSAC